MASKSQRRIAGQPKIRDMPIIVVPHQHPAAVAYPFSAPNYWSHRVPGPISHTWWNCESAISTSLTKYITSPLHRSIDICMVLARKAYPYSNPKNRLCAYIDSNFASPWSHIPTWALHMSLINWNGCLFKKTKPILEDSKLKSWYISQLDWSCHQTNFSNAVPCTLQAFTRLVIPFSSPLMVSSTVVVV